jgi:N-acetylglutamate synthase-like GNAT family acetyltransferase
MTPENTPQTTSSTRGQTPTRTVRLAIPSDLTFLLDLQRHWSNNVGFLPRACFERYTNLGRILVVTENDTPAGYLSWTCTPSGLIRIPQVAVSPELLRTTIGTKLIRHVQRRAVQFHASVIRLTSRSDLSANEFWPTLGFRCTCIFTPCTTRNRPLLEWTLPLISADALICATSRHRRLLPERFLP